MTRTKGTIIGILSLTVILIFILQLWNYPQGDEFLLPKTPNSPHPPPHRVETPHSSDQDTLHDVYQEEGSFVYDGTDDSETKEDSTMASEYSEKSSGKIAFESSIDMQHPLSYLAEKGLLPDNVAHFTNPSNTANPLIDFDRGSVKYLYPEVIDYIYENTNKVNVDWSKYAYVLYATSGAHLCNSFMVFSELRKYGSQADMVLIVNEDFLNKKEEYPTEYKELTEMKDKLNLKYSPVKPITIDSKEDMKIWVSSYTKLLVFGETSYDRIIYMDADSVLLQEQHLDELFFIPPCQVATPAAYWLIDERFGQMTHEEKLKKYPAEKYGFEPLTLSQRLDKIAMYLSNYLAPFLGPVSDKLSYFNNEMFHTLSLNDQINYRNYQHAMYNALPSYELLDDYKLTNIIMVIQPSEELFERVKWGIETKSQDGKDEYDMDIVERLFKLQTNILSQTKSLSKTTKTLDDRINEIPEYMILPPQRYAALTLEFNKWTNHETFAIDSPDQAWVWDRSPDEEGVTPYYYETSKLTQDQGSYLRKQVKYLHFSDAPIPKPWFYRDPKQGYMGARTRCPEFHEFHEELPDGWVKPDNQNTDDCSAGPVWEWAVQHFEETRKEVCGLELIRTDKNAYFDIIN